MDRITSRKNISIICNKQNILLKLDKTLGIYSLEFKCENNKFNIDDLLSVGLYNLMEKLNPDLIERIEILNTYSENELDVLFVFKKIGSELGLSQKYMAMKTVKSQIDNNVCFKSENIDYSKDNFLEQGLNNIEPLICEFAEMIIFNTHLPVIDFYYQFKINTNEDLPIYMENFIGLMMKKIFYNLKEFIDNFDYNK
jgi:hypothetical protein